MEYKDFDVCKMEYKDFDVEVLRREDISELWANSLEEGRIMVFASTETEDEIRDYLVKMEEVLREEAAKSKIMRELIEQIIW